MKSLIAIPSGLQPAAGLGMQSGTLMRCWLLSLSLFMAVASWSRAGSPGAEASSGLPASAHPPTFWLIPHTHWEGAVFKTREEYLQMGLPNLLTAVRLLQEQPNYRFALD